VVAPHQDRSAERSPPGQAVDPGHRVAVLGVPRLHAGHHVVEVAVQVNGKRRAEIEVAKGADKESILEAARAVPNVAKYLENATVVREIVVPERLVNIVVKG
jgi:hypothetical protein